MPSPFPGMNPFLEQDDAWDDFHWSFLAYAQEALNRQVGPNYVVKIKVNSRLRELSAEERRFGENQLRLPAVEVERHRSLEIHNCRNRRIVTAIQLLSPSSKTPGPHRDDYLAQREWLLSSHTNLVEIDLRRGGTRPELPHVAQCDYYVLVRRYEDGSRACLWPAALRDRLPVIPMPLSAADSDVSLDLKAVLDRTYDAADYAQYIYQETPEPPLSPEDLAWARQFLPTANPDKGK